MSRHGGRAHPRGKGRGWTGPSGHTRSSARSTPAHRTPRGTRPGLTAHGRRLRQHLWLRTEGLSMHTALAHAPRAQSPWLGLRKQAVGHRGNSRMHKRTVPDKVLEALY